MWLEVPSGDMWPDIFLWACECGSLELDWYFSGPTVENEYTLDVVCLFCMRNASVNLPNSGRQYMEGR